MVLGGYCSVGEQVRHDDTATRRVERTLREAQGGLQVPPAPSFTPFFLLAIITTATTISSGSVCLCAANGESGPKRSRISSVNAWMKPFVPSSQIVGGPGMPLSVLHCASWIVRCILHIVRCILHESHSALHMACSEQHRTCCVVQIGGPYERRRCEQD